MNKNLKRFYVYAHIRKDSGQVFYVGKGNDTRLTRRSGRNRYWTFIAKKHGYEAIYLEEQLTEGKAYEREEFYIKKYRAQGNKLANLNNGGQNVMSGIKHTEEAKKKIGLGAKGNTYCVGNKLSEKTKRKIGQASKGNTNSLGRKLSPEHRQKISKSLKGKMPKCIPCNKGRKHSAEAIESNRRGQTGKVMSAESRKKISEAMKKIRAKQKNATISKH